MLERIGQMIALVTATCIGFSVLFDWGYFQAIDARMFSSMTLSDHIAAAMERIPNLFFIVAIALVVSLHPGDETKWSEDRKKRHMVLFQIGDREFGPVVLTPTWLWIWTGVFGVLMLLSAFAASNLVFLLCMFWWARLCFPVVQRLRNWGLNWLPPFVFFGPVYAVMAITWGSGAAVADLSKGIGDYTIVLESGDQISGVLVLRTSEHGLYLRDPHAEANLILNWSSVREVRRAGIERTSLVRDYVCRWTGLCSTIGGNDTTR